MKAFVLIFILSGEPLVIDSFDTSALCAAELADIKAGTEKSDIDNFRCITEAQYRKAVHARYIIDNAHGGG